MNRASHGTAKIVKDRARAKTAAGPAPGIGPAIDRLAEDLRLLRIEFEKFFNGALDVPPEELRNRLAGELRRLRAGGAKSVADDFRLATLEAQFNSHADRFSRRLREREEGRPMVPRPAHHVARADGPVVLGGQTVSTEDAETLYRRLAQGGNAPRFDLESFRVYLTRQLTAIQSKTGRAEVEFRIAQEDGQLKLRARPV